MEQIGIFGHELPQCGFDHLGWDFETCNEAMVDLGLSWAATATPNMIGTSFQVLPMLSFFSE